MDREELRNKFTEVLTVEDHAKRSTMLNDMRSEVEKNFKELDDLKAENTKLVEKNNSLTEANSKLFMQIGVESFTGEKPKQKQKNLIDLRKLGI
jgi:regulator of replication initiation timing|nr:MAG TPA: Phi29 scaffolding protein [Caudoviricetes sp.]